MEDMQRVTLIGGYHDGQTMFIPPGLLELRLKHFEQRGGRSVPFEVVYRRARYEDIELHYAEGA